MISMNTTITPFDDLNVRRAVVAALDRDALRRTRGGEPFGDVATHFLPPRFAGFEEGGGLKGPPLDYVRKPQGDLELAKSYLRKAGYAGGLYTGRERLLMVGTNLEPGRATAEEAHRQLRRLGFRLDFRIVPQDVLYERFCNRPAARVAICPNVGFFADFHDPESLLRPVFDGKRILPRENLNFSQLDDPQINVAMDRASRLAPGPERDKAWGRIDRLIAAEAPGVPWNWDRTPLVASKDVKAVPNPATKSWDLSFSSLKGAR
jgi:peptide/nickel transport system substrate-binding protein